MSATVTAIRAFLYAMAVPVIVAFLLCVGLGWFFSLKTGHPTLTDAEITSVSVLVALAVYGSLVHTGKALAGWKRIRGWLGAGAILFLFAGTLLLSFVGTFTASMLLFEGPVILREHLNTTRERLLRLESVANGALRVPQLEAVTARVNAWRQTLMSEIDNPAFCGVGRRAKEAIQEIQKDLESVRLLNGTDARVSCSDRPYLERLKRQYGDMIDRALLEHPYRSQFRADERARAREEVATTVQADRRAIDAALGRLAGVNHFILRLGLFNESAAVLAQANGDYGILYQRLRGLLDEGWLPVPPRIDGSAVEQMSSGLQVWNVILARADRITTWVYFAIAITADLVALLIATNAIALDRGRDDLRAKRLAERDLETAGVAYLWSPAPHPGARARTTSSGS